jgi:hypothetical protein
MIIHKFYPLETLRKGQKRERNTRWRAVLTAEVQPLDYRMEAKQAKTLLDTWSMASVISGKIIPRRYWRRWQKRKFETKTGTFRCHFIVKLEIVLPELRTMKSFTWNFFVDDTNQDDNYDMIIGDNCMAAIGIDILYSRGLIEWDDSAAPMHQEGDRKSSQRPRDTLDVTRWRTAYERSNQTNCRATHANIGC